MSTSTAIVLTLARTKVAHGWTQHQGRDAYGNVCAAQAILESSGGADSITYDACVLLLSAAGILGTNNNLYPEVPHWNDAPGRTKEEVLAAFDKAIEIAQGREVTIDYHPDLVVAKPKPVLDVHVIDEVKKVKAMCNA